jgi:hypothetical protein
MVLVSRDSALAHTSGYGTINPLSIDYACRPRLRSRLTLGGSACPRNPWSSGARVSHPRHRYSCLHSHPHHLHRRSHPCFIAGTALPYPPPPLNPEQQPPNKHPQHPPSPPLRKGKRQQGAPRTRTSKGHHKGPRSPTLTGRLWKCRGFGGVLKPRYIVGAESLDQ